MMSEPRRGTVVQATVIRGEKLPPPRKPYVMAITPADEADGISWQCPNCQNERILARPDDWRPGLSVMHTCDGCGLSWKLMAELMKGGDTSPFTSELSDEGQAAIDRAIEIYQTCLSVEPTFFIESTGPNQLSAKWKRAGVPYCMIVQPLSIETDQLAFCMRNLIVSAAVQVGALDAESA